MLLAIVMCMVVSACSPTNANNPGNNPFFPTDGLAAQSVIPTITPTPTPQASFSLGEMHLISGDYDLAYAEFLPGSTQTVDQELQASSMLGLGKALLLKKDYRAAVNQFSSLLNNFPDGEARNTAFFFLAKTYEALEQPRLAADAYASYLAAMPSALNSEINEMRAEALMIEGDYNAAIVAFESALINVDPLDYDRLQLALADALTRAGQQDRAISVYLSLLESSISSYVKSQSNLLLGRIYTQMGLPEQAYARYQDSVENYKEEYDTYSALSQLVEEGQAVNPLKRGIIDYYAGQYSIAMDILQQYILENEDHTAEAHSYRALSFYEINEYENEVLEWDKVINEHSSEHEYYFRAYEEKSNTQWWSLYQYLEAADTCLTYVASVPDDSINSPKMLDKAARIYVDGGYLSMAAQTYERILNEYPGSDLAYSGLFKAGILYFRQEEYDKSLITFERLIVLTDIPSELAAANLWVGKTLYKMGRTAEATEYYQKAAAADPTGYYSIRADQIINEQSPFPVLQNIDLGIDLDAEKQKADQWVRTTFQLEPSVDLSTMAELSSNPEYIKAKEYIRLGMREEASSQLETLRTNLLGNAVGTYRLMNQALQMGFYRTAIYASRHVLDLAGLSQAATLTTPPVFFNHIRFGTFFKDYVVPDAVEHELDPMLIFSLIRQESMFDSSIVSVASAKGLMQITPGTAVNIVENYGWPQNFTTDDLNRPMVNIRLGVHYFRRCLDIYDGDYYAALSSYNAGDTATTRWMELAKGDPDLFLEIISYSETKNYIMSIAENHVVYRDIYTR